MPFEMSEPDLVHVLHARLRLADEQRNARAHDSHALFAQRWRQLDEALEIARRAERVAQARES